MHDNAMMPGSEPAAAGPADAPETKEEAASLGAAGEAAPGLSAAAIVALIGLCLAAVGLRLLFTWQYRPTPESDFLWYREAGLAAAKHGLGSLFRANPPVPLWVLSLWPPGYPLFLGMVYSIHPGLWAAPVAQAILAGVSCYVIFVAARRWQGNGWAAAAIMACYPQAIVYSAIHGSEVLSVFLLSLAIALSVGPMRDRQAISYGCALGLTSLTRAHTVFVLPGVIASLWRRRAALVLVLVFTFAMILPWSLSRAKVFGRPVLLTTFSGHLFHMGNHRTNPTGGYYEVPRPVEIPADATTPDEDSYFLAAGLREVLLSPSHYLEVSGKRMLMWVGFQRDEWVEKYSPRWIAGLSMIAQITLFFAALVAMIGAWRERTARVVIWPAVSLLVLTALTYHMPRYTLIILPYFAVITSRLRLDWFKFDPAA